MVGQVHPLVGAVVEGESRGEGSGRRCTEQEPQGQAQHRDDCEAEEVAGARGKEDRVRVAEFVKLHATAITTAK